MVQREFEDSGLGLIGPRVGSAGCGLSAYGGAGHGGRSFKRDADSAFGPGAVMTESGRDEGFSHSLNVGGNQYAIDAKRPFCYCESGLNYQSDVFFTLVLPYQGASTSMASCKLP